MHIPKTAGSAIRKQLFAALKPSTGIDVKNIDPSLSLEKRRAQATRLFLNASKQNKFRCAGGHITMQDALRILHQYPDAKLMTFLRDPVERVISDFAYFRQQRIEGAQTSEGKQLFASLEGYIDHVSSQDKMVRFLSPNQPLSDAQLVHFIEKRFSFIGIQDRYSRSCQLLGSLLGVELDSDARVRDSTREGGNKPVVSDADRKAISAKNPRDCFLFDYFSEKLKPYI